MNLADQFAGCLLGLALGDALGAPFEGGLIERLTWRLLGKTRRGQMRWTDDTQMSLDFAESLILNSGLNTGDLAARFARSYRWDRGYGPATAKLLRSVARGAMWTQANRSVYPEGSLGNGGAMRAPVGALFYASRIDEVVSSSREAARITHAHPLGIEGALLVAAAICKALSSSDPVSIAEFAASWCREKPYVEKTRLASSWLESGHAASPHEVRSELGNGVAATESCVTAVYLGLRFLDQPFLALQSFVAKCRGDVDTIGAISGALWGARNGSALLPQAELRMLEAADRIRRAAEDLHQAAGRWSGN